MAVTTLARNNRRNESAPVLSPHSNKTFKKAAYKGRAQNSTITIFSTNDAEGRDKSETGFP